MAHGIRGRAIGWNGSDPLQSVPAEIEPALRRARPKVRELDPEAAAMMLASALNAAAARDRARRAMRVAGPLALAACTLAAFLATGGSHRVDGQDAAAPIQRELAVKSAPRAQTSLIVRAPNHRTARISMAHQRRRRGIAARTDHQRFKVRTPRADRDHIVSADRANVAAGAQALPALPMESAYPGGGTISPGRLVVIVSGTGAARLNVEISRDRPVNSGFAIVAAYMPIGPGGGVLTQCTARDDGGGADTNTTQYGIVYGEPASRLVDQPDPANGTSTETN